MNLRYRDDQLLVRDTVRDFVASRIAPNAAAWSEAGEFPRYVVGAPDKVRDQLIDMASVLNADELMVVTVMHGHRERMYSYKLLADAFGLKPR